MKDNRGMTIIELITVISIVGILIAATSTQFIGWRANYRIESEVKQIYTDLMNARLKAMQRNRVHFVVFPTTTSYSVYEDTNPQPDGDTILQTASDTLLPTFPKTVGDAVTWAGGTITFDTKGIVQPSASPLGATLCVASTNTPDYDCIVISQTRVNMGKMTNPGGSCDATNCVAK